MPTYCGIVEGFYWREKHTIAGRYAEFDREKRKRLLELMAGKGLNIYVYDPKVLRGENCERAYSPQLVGNRRDWEDTFGVASQNGIAFVWGLAPGRHEHWHGKLKHLQETVDYVLGLGAAGFALLFDDVPGAEMEFETVHQAELANDLIQKYPGKICGLCSGVYCGARTELEQKLATLDDRLDSSIDIVVTGSEVWPASIQATDLPRYKSNRKQIVWDNWMAYDTSDPQKLEFRPPRQRGRGLFDEINGYWLNPSFPVERMVHMITAVGEMFKRRGSVPEREEAALIERMARDWADFLEVDRETVSKFMMLRTGKAKGHLHPEEIQPIIEKWPSLEPVLRLVTV